MKIESEVWVTQLWTLSHPPLPLSHPPPAGKYECSARPFWRMVTKHYCITSYPHPIAVRMQKIATIHVLQHGQKRPHLESDFPPSPSWEAGDCSHPPPMAHRDSINQRFAKIWTGKMTSLSWWRHHIIVLNINLVRSINMLVTITHKRIQQSYITALYLPSSSVHPDSSHCMWNNQKQQKSHFPKKLTNIQETSG